MSATLLKLRTNRKVVIATVCVLLMIAAFLIVKRVRSAPSLPTAVVARKGFVDYVEVHGEIRAQHSLSIVAPPE